MATHLTTMTVGCMQGLKHQFRAMTHDTQDKHYIPIIKLLQQQSSSNILAQMPGEMSGIQNLKS